MIHENSFFFSKPGKRARQLFRSTHVRLPALPQVEGEIVEDVLGELVLELRVESQHLDQPRDVHALEVAVGEGADIAAGLDDDLWQTPGTGGGRLVRGAQVFRDVAADEVTLAYKKGHVIANAVTLNYLIFNRG